MWGEIKILFVPLRTKLDRCIMIVFSGKSESKIDAKGRVFIPAVFRRQLPENDREKVVVRMDVSNKYLVIYPENVWQNKVLDLQKKLNEWDANDQLLLMRFVEDAEILDIDSQGRILLPKRFISAMNIVSETVFVGLVDRIALWNKPAYLEFQNSQPDLSDILRNKLTSES